MSQDESRDRIILRQEILLPVGWTLSPTNGTLQAGPAVPPQPLSPQIAPPQSISPQVASPEGRSLEKELLKAIAALLAQKAAPPCGCGSKGGTVKATTAFTDIDHFISTPVGVVDISSGEVTATGHSQMGDNGPRRLCVQIFPGCASGGGSIGGGLTEVCRDAPSGTLLAPDWSVGQIPVTPIAGSYTVVATATFLDGTTVTDEECFTGIVSSGMGASEVPFPEFTAMSPAVELPPAQAYAIAVEETPDSVATLVLKLDPYCTTPEQPIWRSPVGSGPCEWILKVGRHSQRLYGALIRRDPAGPDKVWLADDFRVDSENTLSCELGSGRTAIVRPA